MEAKAVEAPPPAPAPAPAEVPAVAAHADGVDDAFDAYERMPASVSAAQVEDAHPPAAVIAASEPVAPTPEAAEVAATFELPGVPAAPLAAAAVGAVGVGTNAAPALVQLAIQARLGAEAVDGPFQVGEDLVRMVVKGELLARMSGLVAWSGQIEVVPERKRFRGRVTDKPFGEGSRANRAALRRLRGVRRAAGEGGTRRSNWTTRAPTSATSACSRSRSR